MKIKLPWWLIAIIIFETLPMFGGPFLVLNNPQFLGGPEAETVNQAAYIYSARNIAVGIALILATYLRNAPMLFGLILVRLLTDLGDMPTIIYFDLVSSPARAAAIFIVLYYIPAIFALRYLWKQINRLGG